MRRWLASRWSVFRDWLLQKGMRWSLVALFMRTRIAQVAAVIPLVGYALLWSQKASEYLALQEVLGSGLFGVTWRLLLIYFGAHFLAAAWATYLIWCPPDIKRTPELEAYLSQEMQTHSRSKYDRLRGELAKRIVPDPGDPNLRCWERTTTPATLCEVFPAATVMVASKNNPNSDQRSTVLEAFFLLSEGSNPVALLAAICFAAVGSLLVTLPSVEVFWLVATKVLLPKLGV